MGPTKPLLWKVKLPSQDETATMSDEAVLISAQICGWRLAVCGVKEHRWKQKTSSAFAAWRSVTMSSRDLKTPTATFKKKKKKNTCYDEVIKRRPERLIRWSCQMWNRKCDESVGSPVEQSLCLMQLWKDKNITMTTLSDWRPYQKWNCSYDEIIPAHNTALMKTLQRNFHDRAFTAGWDCLDGTVATMTPVTTTKMSRPKNPDSIPATALPNHKSCWIDCTLEQENLRRL